MVELLVVITIVTVLLTMLIPAISAARETARRVVCSSQLRGFAAAMLIYEQDNQLLPEPRTTVVNYIADNSHNILRDDYGVAANATICPSSSPFPSANGDLWSKNTVNLSARTTYYYFGGRGSSVATNNLFTTGGVNTGWNPTGFHSNSKGFAPIMTTLKPGIKNAPSLDLQYLMGDLTTNGPMVLNYFPDFPNHSIPTSLYDPEGTNVVFADGHSEWQLLRRGSAWEFYSNASFNVYWSPKCPIPATVTMMP